ncbi:hypothetical protein O977_17015 [Mycobacterium avium subsp. paratuberculosis 10-5975]|nr:hypothetical protein O977_17015 [Mycobacterium avium subsp. paratuberculosis 10-5975]
MSGYAPVDASDYAIALPNPGHLPLKEMHFVTPDGITCGFGNPPAAGCTGNNLPGIGPENKNPYTYVGTDTGIQPATSTPYVNSAIQNQIRTLAPFHTITVEGVVCGVDNSGTTACKDAQDRAFILSPHGSKWLPHV